MGSGATKVRSDDSDATRTSRKSSIASVVSENNNNNVPKKKPLMPAVKNIHPLRTEQRKKTPLSDTTHSSDNENTQSKLPPLQTNRTNHSSVKTEIVSLKPAQLQVEGREPERTNDAITRLNRELANSESRNLDLKETVQILEEKVSSKEQKHPETSFTPESLQETLNAKDQYILRLEREAKVNQAEANKMRIKLKKRIKTLTNQLHEVRQDSSISQMELKAEIAKQDEQIKSLQAGRLPLLPSSQAEATNHPDQDHSKIIVELSSQLSEQAQQISSLESELSDKKKEISDLKLAISNHYDSKDGALSAENPTSRGSTLLPDTSTDRLHSSRGKRTVNFDDKSCESNKAQCYSDSLDTSSSFLDDKYTKNYSPQPLERQSTALSDSDSDWGESLAPSHTHSAPARSRVKSAMSLTKSDSHKGSLVTLNGNDDSVMDLISASPIDPIVEPMQRGASDMYKKSALRNHLEKARKENQTKALIGPSLAFENKKPDPFSDTSCEPTPRTQRAAFNAGSKIRIVKPIIH